MLIAEGKTTRLAVTLALLATFAGAADALGSTTWKIQSLYGAGHQVWDETLAFAEHVKELTGGRLILEISPSGRLEAVSAGVFDGPIRSIANHRADLRDCISGIGIVAAIAT
jgi:TRAP-type C4-dicarboxylate transport system substrate-binding protein